MITDAFSSITPAALKRPELPPELAPELRPATVAKVEPSPRPTEASRDDARARVKHDPQALQQRARAEAIDPARTKELLGRHAPGSAAHDVIGRAIGSAGFARLEPGSQERLATLLGGKNEDLSAPARERFSKLLDRSGRLDAPAQARQMEGFLRDQPHLPEYIAGAGDTALNGKAQIWPRRVDPSAPFEKGPAPGRTADVSIDGGTTEVTTPDRSTDRRFPAITTPEIAETLRTIPRAARDAIGGIYSNPTPSRDKSGDYEFGAADEVSRRLDLYPGPDARKPGALAATVAHEAGHALSFQRLGKDLDNDAGRAYRDAILRDRLAPSVYGKGDPHEDFAETFALYSKHRGTPLEREVRELFPARMKVIDWAVQSDPSGVVEHGGYR